MSENSWSSTVAASVDPRAGRPQCGNGPADSLALEVRTRAAPAGGDARGRRSAENWSSELPDGVVLEGAVPDLIVLDRERHGGAKHGVADDVRGAGDRQRRVASLERVVPDRGRSLCRDPDLVLRERVVGDRRPASGVPAVLASRDASTVSVEAVVGHHAVGDAHSPLGVVVEHAVLHAGGSARRRIDAHGVVDHPHLLDDQAVTAAAGGEEAVDRAPANDQAAAHAADRGPVLTGAENPEAFKSIVTK